MATERPASDFGMKLRASRERRGIPLRYIAEKTKISVVALEALERGDFSRLPGGIFSRAFVRSYAMEVGLDAEQTIQEFLRESPNDSSPAADHSHADTVEDSETFESERRTATTFLGLIAISVPLVAVVLYFSTGLRTAGSNTSPRTAEQTTDTPPVTATPGSVAPAPAPASEPAVSPAAAAVDPAAAVQAISSPPEAPNAPAGRLTIDLSATDECWVSATTDGARRIERVLHAGDRETLEVTRELVLNVGNAAALALRLNGAAARPLGTAGQVVTARLTPANFKEYLPAQ